MGMGEALGMMFSGAAGEYAGNRGNEIRDEEKQRLMEAREVRMAELQNRYATEAREDQQAYGTAERVAGQEYGTKEREASQAFTADQAAKSQAFQAGQNALSRASSEKVAGMKASGKGSGTDGEPGPGEEGGVDTNWTKNEQGQWGRIDVYSNGRQKWTPANAQMSQRLDNREEAVNSAGKPSEGEMLVDKLLANPDVGVGTTRALADMSDVGKGAYELLQNVKGDENKQVFNAQKRLNGMLLQGGVAAAKALGASGINTAAEAKMYFEAMPKLDYSSVDNYKSSLNDIKRYIQSEKRNAGIRLGVDPSAYEYMNAKPEAAPAASGPATPPPLPAYTPSHEAAAAPAGAPKKYW